MNVVSIRNSRRSAWGAWAGFKMSLVPISLSSAGCTASPYCAPPTFRPAHPACPQATPHNFPAARTTLNHPTLCAGEGAPNVIPDSVTLSGTIRSFDKAQFARLRQRVTEVFTSTAALHGCTADVSWSETPYPPLVNDAELTAAVLGWAGELVGSQKAFALDRPHSFAEDFAFVAEQVGTVPTLFISLGVQL